MVQLREKIRCEWFAPDFDALVNAVLHIYWGENGSIRKIEKLPGGRYYIEYYREEIYPGRLLYPLNN